jgi:hypothetical protein
MQKQPSEILVGADVEEFIVSSEYGFIEPCVGVLPGTKQEPHQPPDMNEGFGIQEDNVMAEWNIPPAANYQYFDGHIQQIRDAVQRRLMSKGYELAVEVGAAHQFAPKHLLSDQAKTFGCDPDNDAYTGGKQRVYVPAVTRWRSAGGHVHLGGDFNCPDFVAALFAELFISVKNAIYASDTERKQWYGKPGIFRSKPYGIEYRTLDNQWALSRNTRQTVGFSALMCSKFLTETDAGELQEIFRAIPWTQVREVVERGHGGDEGTHIITTARKAGVPI